MSNFIDDLERELLAAEDRPVRLAAARVPLPPKSAVLFIASLAVCVAVIAAIFVARPAGQVPLRPAGQGSPRPAGQGSPRPAGKDSLRRASPTTTLRLRPTTKTAKTTAATTPTTTTTLTAKTKTHNRIIEQCRGPLHEITGGPTLSALREAIAVMPDDIARSTDCPAMIVNTMVYESRIASSHPVTVHDRVITQCLADGSLTGRHPVDQLRRALAVMPTDALQHSRCPKIIVSRLGKPTNAR